MKLPVSNIIQPSVIIAYNHHQGCMVSSHTDEAPQVPAPAPKASSANVNLTLKETKDGAEVYSTGVTKAALPKPSSPAPVEAPVVEDEDDLSVPVSPGTICKRKGCGTVFVDDEANRIGDGDETVCIYHPASVRLMVLMVSLHVG
jgi:hypothetical protein